MSGDSVEPGCAAVSLLTLSEHRICLNQKARRGFSKAASICLNERSEGVFEAA